MKSKSRKIITSFVLSMALIISSVMPAFAAEPTTKDMSEISSRAITLPAGQNFLLFGDGTLTFTNNYTTDIYYVQGRWINLGVEFGTASIDQGIGGIYLTVDIINADNNQVLYTERDYVPTKGTRAGTDFTFDLGTSIRNIRIRFDASSYGQSNGHYRSAYLTGVRSYVFG